MVLVAAHHLSYEVQEHHLDEDLVCLFRGHRTARNLALCGQGALLGAGLLLGFPSFMLLSLAWGSTIVLTITVTVFSVTKRKREPVYNLPSPHTG